MKSLTLLTLGVVVLLFAALVSPAADRPAREPKGEKPAAAERPTPGARRGMEGAWRMVSYKPAGVDEYVKLPEGVQHTKLVAGGRLVWTTIKDGKIIRSAGGKFTARGNEYTEQYEFVLDPQDEWMIGKTGRFRGKLEGNRWHHDGVIRGDNGDVRIEEIWERLK